MCYTHSSKCRISSETNDKALNAITQLIYFPTVPKCFPGAEKLSCQNLHGLCCQPQQDSSALHHLSYSCWVSTLNAPSLRPPSRGGGGGCSSLDTAEEKQILPVHGESGCWSTTISYCLLSLMHVFPPQSNVLYLYVSGVAQM